GDMSHHQDIYDNPSLSKKVFANMKRVGTGFSRQKSKKQQPTAPKVPSPEPSPEHKLPSPSNDLILGDKDCMKFQELMDLCTQLSNKVLDLESEVIDIKFTFTYRIKKLEDRVDSLEEENRVLKEKSFKSSKVDIAAPVVEKEKSFKQGRIIADIDEDDVDDEEPAEVEEVLEVVTAAKLMTEVVTTAEATTTAQAPKVSASRKRRGVVIQDPEETTTSVIMHSEVQSKDKGKVMRYQALKRKPFTEAQARKNMMIYLNNMAGFKMNYFKGMTYSEIRLLFEKHYNSNQAFLEKMDEEVTVQEKEVEEEGHKRQGRSLENETTKKQKIDEEKEELKSHLHIVSNDDDDDDDVYTEATPLASKIPVVDYQIHLDNNKPYYKIIRADGNHKLFLSFITLLKNFDREDLESLWKLVKERFEKTEPKNYSAKVKGWKLFESCGVHSITFLTTQMFLLVEKKYPLTHFTLEQLLNNVRHKVKEESEMYLELLKLVRRQLNEGSTIDVVSEDIVLPIKIEENNLSL
nr:hypothetical protein [Tanacetum cinerariifolium]